jgi:ferrochelatase
MIMSSKIGVLLTNTGSPDAPTTSAVRRYLREFLSDRRVVKIPRLVWLPILYLFILPLRPRKSALLYQKIWTPHGSPMRFLMHKLQYKLRDKINTDGDSYAVEVGMNYGNPSISHALEKLRQQNIDKLIVLPLYPQYSNTTCASTFDRVTAALQTMPSLPHIKFIRDYHNHPAYIAALAKSVKDFWQTHNKAEHMLISFHGLPKRFAEAGDPYPEQCEQTASLLATALNLTPDQWTLCYQSQFGYDKWLQPSTQKLLETLPARGIKNLDVICPGFSIDCLETLEEIAKQGAHDFSAAGGTQLRMIPALNDSDAQVEMIKLIAFEHIPE